MLEVLLRTICDVYKVSTSYKKYDAYSPPFNAYTYNFIASLTRQFMGIFPYAQFK